MLVSPSWAQDSIKDARQKRDSAVNAQANAAAQIDFLKAQDADVADAVQQVNLAVTAQQAKVEASQQGLANAEQEAATQNALVADAQTRIVDVRAQVGALMVEDYMGRSAADTTAILRSPSLVEGLQRAALLDAVSTDRRRVTSTLRGLQADLDAALRPPTPRSSRHSTIAPRSPPSWRRSRPGSPISSGCVPSSNGASPIGARSKTSWPRTRRTSAGSS